jgi:hypothetical protein
MKLVLHIGSGKTGTTSIQNFFVRNADELKKHGVLYPVNKSVAPNHILLPAGFVRNNSIPIPHNRFYLNDFNKYKKDFVRFMHALDGDIKNIKPDVLVLSAEQLFRDFSEVSEMDFSEFLRPYFDEITVVAYVRDPVGDYASRISQKVRTGTLMFPPIVRDVRSVLEYYESQFPGCVHVNAFERDQLINGDVVFDFISKYVTQALGTLQAAKLPSYNESLPVELLFKLQEQRLRFQPEGKRPEIETSAFISLMTRNFSEAYPAKKNGKLKLKPEIEDYLRQSAIDYLWLRDKYGVTFNSLNYENISTTESGFVNCSRLSEVALVDASLSEGLDHIIPSASVLANYIRTKRYILNCQLMRIYRIFIARGWLGQFKRKLFN